VGTGIENPALYAQGMYYESPDHLWINFYAPSAATWAAKGADLAMRTTLPEGDAAKLTLTLKGAQTFTLALRRPAWTTPAFEIRINGEKFNAPAPGKADAGTYVEIARTWKSGDTIELQIPKTLRLEPTPDDPTLAAVLWGPLVLAADLGTTPPARGPAPRGPGARGPALMRNFPAIVSAAPVTEWLTPVADQPGQFKAEGRTLAAPDQAVPLTFIPLYRLHDHTQSVYMSIYTPDEFQRRTAAAPGQ
jgi:DUF1680 family protein